MLAVSTAVVLLCILLLMGQIAIPGATSHRQIKLVRTWMTMLIALQAIAGLVLAVAYAFATSLAEPVVYQLLSASFFGINVSIYLDGVSLLMLLLVSVVGLNVARFSIRYLDGELAQGRYFQWMALTLGSVSLMVISGNLVQFVVLWIVTSLGLHQLLVHYRERPGATRAAATKFAVSRLGDALLLAAIGLSIAGYGTLEFAELLPMAQSLAISGETSHIHHAIAWLLMLGAAIKSAQFPFHTWLPNTLETPTPVSALMHAGIVNAGGYMLIRLNPLVVVSPSALTALACLGLATAVFASLSMMCQSSVKKSLAYSTVAQMGFMMLQCGLGAFSAAMLHILAHSLYKAHAFLSSGSVLSEARAMRRPDIEQSSKWSVSMLLSSLIGVGVIVCLINWGVHGHPWQTPEGMALVFCMWLAFTAWHGKFAGGQQANLRNFLNVAGLCAVYGLSYLAVDQVVHSALFNDGTNVHASSWSVAAVVLTFSTLFVLNLMIQGGASSHWLASLRSHALNGFYVDALYQRMFRQFDPF